MTKNKKKLTSDHYFSSSPKSETNYGLIRAKFLGRNFEFITASSVFSKRRIDTGTQLLVESMILPEKGSVLDIGCGYGAVGIAAARFNSKLQIYMTDVNTRAVNLAKKNIENNKIANAQARCGHLYEPVEDLKFDCILSNPPVSAGMETVKTIITEAKKNMQPEAVFEMVIRSKIGAKMFPELFSETFGNCTIVARGSGFRVLLGKYSK
ncbi:MAG: methyltransferase [Nitrososphaerota archaeon]|jgi:16S rRNA (guanine1207-N2)-methyltransferase|nr:methyltransferase [Nitrososphaerota archaeon]